MASLNSKHPNKILTLAWAYGPYALICGFLWIAFYLLNCWLFHENSGNELLLYFGEKSLLVYHGTYQQTENIYFITPFIPYLFVLIFYDPFLACAFLGAFSLTFLLYMIQSLVEKQQISKGNSLLCIAYLLFSPAFLFLFCQSMYHMVTFWFLMIAGYSLRRYYFERLSSYLMLFSFILALLITNTLVGYYSLLIFLPIILIITYTQNRPYTPILIVVLFPTFFFHIINTSLTYYYTQKLCFICPWTFPLALTKGNQILEASQGIYIAPNFEILVATGSLLSSFKLFFEDLFRFLLLCLPFWIFWTRITRYGSKAAFAIIAAIPISWIFARIYLGFYTPSVLEHLIFVLYAFLFFHKLFGPKYERNLWLSFVVAAAFCLSFIAGFYQQWNSPLWRESYFIRTLWGQGKPFPNLETSKTALSLMQKPGRILLDDAYLYKLVYLAQDPKRFILPYEEHFKIALANPQQFAKYVIVSKLEPSDAILRKYPNAFVGQLDGFRLVADLTDMIVYEAE